MEEAVGAPNDEVAPLRLSVTSRSGSVVVKAEPGARLRVDGGNVTHEADGTVRVEASGGRARLTVLCPEGSDLRVGTASGRVELEGRFGDVRVTTASGRVEVGEADQADLRTASGRVKIGVCHGKCRVRTASSRVEIGRAGQVEASSASGRVEVVEAGAAEVTTASGRIEVGATGAGPIRVRSVSGHVEVGLPKGVHPATTLHTRSGRVRCDCATGDDCVLEVSTVSGTVAVVCR